MIFTKVYLSFFKNFRNKKYKLNHWFYLDRRNVLRNHNDWAIEFSYEGIEETNKNEAILGDAHEALTRFYQKASKRSKTAKQKKHCWD